MDICGWAFDRYALCSDCITEKEAEELGGTPVFGISGDATLITCEDCFHTLACSVYMCLPPCDYAEKG